MKLVNPAIFREYDVRGIAGKEISEKFAYRLAQTYVAWAKEKSKKPKLKISVGRDCRLSSDAYAEAVIRGLIESGFDVVDLGVCPTPVTYFSVHHLATDGAIMVTGSHNPSGYNGFKIALGKNTLHGHQIQELMRILISDEIPTAQYSGHVCSENIIEAYIQAIVKDIKPSRKLKVVLDAGNGTASTVAPQLFQTLGAEVIPLFCELDGNFPNHHPDPTVAANLAHVVDAVLKHKADFGIGYDGDSDRIGVVNENGQVMYGDELMVIFSRDVLKHHPGATIISEVKSSQRLYQDIETRGGRGLMWKTGHSLIKTKMRETGALLAGEMSGHIFFADRWFGFDDALYASARLYEILGAGQTLSSLTADLPKLISTPEIRLACPDAIKFKLIHEAAAVLSAPDAKLTTLDGLRLDYDNRWGLLRASNTQPVIVMRFEAKNEILLDQIRTQFEAALNTAAEKLGHGKFNSKDNG